MSEVAEVALYCPSCAAPVPAATTYCKGCGADLRYVPRALQGGLTARQRSFVATLSLVPVLVTGAGIVVPGAATDGIALAVAGLWTAALAVVVVRLAFMLARDGSSPDSVFRPARPGRASLVTPLLTKRHSGSADDETPSH